MERMFNVATSFNSDVSSWDIGSVTNLNDMFQGATSFNQNLCAWGETFPYNPEYSGFEYNVVNDMFLDSGCTYQDTPQEDTALKNEPVLEEENVVLLEDDSNFDDW